jgi:hypothetical protein
MEGRSLERLKVNGKRSHADAERRMPASEASVDTAAGTLSRDPEQTRRTRLAAEAVVVFGLLELHGARNLLYSSYVRVRILKRLPGVIDGISLHTLIPGLAYDLPHELAQRLIVERVAREDHSHGAEVLIPSGNDEDDEDLVDHITRGVRVTQVFVGEAGEPLRGPPKTKR